MNPECYKSGIQIGNIVSEYSESENVFVRVNGLSNAQVD